MYNCNQVVSCCEPKETSSELRRAAKNSNEREEYCGGMLITPPPGNVC